MSSSAFLAIAMSVAVGVALVDQWVKAIVARAHQEESARPRLAFHWSLHERDLMLRSICRTRHGAWAVLAVALAGVGIAHGAVGEVGGLPLLALCMALGGASSNALDLHRHGGVVNCATWRDRVAFNPADVAIVVGAVLAALSLVWSPASLPGAGS